MSESKSTYEAALERSHAIEKDIVVNPKKYRVLTGDRPTGRLHIGHYFGSLQNRSSYVYIDCRLSGINRS